MGGSRVPRVQPTFRAGRTGLAQALGDLETRIMETLWRLGVPATVSDVQKSMSGPRREYHTVTTVMIRLCRKGVLRRNRRGGVWHYAPRLSHDEFRQHVAQEVIRGVFALAPEAAINSMLDAVAALNPAGLEALADLVERKRRERGR